MEYKVVGQIYQTDDYDIFKKLDGNRDASNVKAILKSIENVGCVLSPILVNENFEVIDGQHRLEAFKEKKLPVKFMVQKGIGLRECQAINTGMQNWQAMDFVRSYAEIGNENYIRLLDLWTEYHKDFGLDGIIGIAIEVREGGSTPYLRNAELDMSSRRYEVAKQRMNFLREIGMVKLFKEKKLYKRTFWNAIGYAFRHPEISIKELCERIEKSPLEIVTYNKTVDQLKLFDEIYNKGRKTKKVFMATDYQLGKYKSEVL